MLKRIIKRSGEIEEFTPSKVNQWGIWSAATLGDRVDWSSIVLDVIRDSKEEMHSQELQRALINKCAEKKDWPHQVMGGRLYAALCHKDFYGNEMPTVKVLFDKLHDLGLMVRLNFTEDEYAQANEIIDHSRDFDSAYFQLDQILTKYSLQNRKKKKKYETAQFTYMRMAMALCQRFTGPIKMVHVKNYYDHFSLCRINPPSPNYINLGTKLNGYASCCLYTVADNSDSLAIGDHIAYKMTCMSAGIGSHLNVRSTLDPVRGGLISHNGKLPYFQSLAKAVKANTQAGRGGACTSYFSCYDPEIVTLLMLQNPRTVVAKQNIDIHFAFQYNRFFATKVAKNENIFFFNAFTAPDLQQAFFSGDDSVFEKIYNKYEADPEFVKTYYSAREISTLARQQAYEVSTVYMADMTEINRHTPHKDTIHSSNLCVAPETKILTDNGYIPIISLVGQTVNVWNGEEYSQTVVIKTGEFQKLIKVKTDSGYELDCTSYHKFYIFDGYGKPYKEVRAGDLNPGDKLCKFDLPIIEGKYELKDAYVNGFYTGDGCLTDQGQRIYLYGEKKELSYKFQDGSPWYIGDQQDRIYKHYQTLMPKFFVPANYYSIKSRLEWLAGWLDADGCVYRNGENQQVVGASVEFEFLKQVQLMLQTLGVSCKVTELHQEGFRQLPANNGSGLNKDFWCRKTYRLIITSTDVQSLLSLGLTFGRLIVKPHQPQRDAKHFIIVKSIEDQGRYDDTYCFTEPKKHMGMFNGLLTGQCTEITQPTFPYFNMMDLYSTEDHGRGEVSLCSLAALVTCNIHSDEVYESASYYSLLMTTECINLSDYPLPHIGFTAKQRMNAGIGVLGVATHMARKNLKYSSQEGKDEIHRLAEKHAYFTIKASLKIGKEIGNAPWMHKTKWPEGWLPIDTYKKAVDSVSNPGLVYNWEELRAAIIANKGIAHSSLITGMPTESSSKGSGVPNCWYPVRSLAMKKSDESNVIDWCAVDNDILADQYELAWNIPTKDMIEVYAIIQKFTDQSISADFWRDRSTPEKLTISNKEMRDEFLLMVKLGQKSRYYQHSLTASNGKKTATVKEEVCASGACDV